ncbi:MAG: hypothetical protein ACOH1I_10950 [Gallionellaceae bacterium]|jgi:hypothetical protein
MSIFRFSISFAIGISLLAPFAHAQDLNFPDKIHRKGMSYEEYSVLREKMRMRMEQLRTQNNNLKQEHQNHPDYQAERSNPDSAYGKGYQSRKKPEIRTDNNADSRPERPHAERFNRGNMIRR